MGNSNNRENCWRCSSVNGCLAECNDGTDTFELVGTWNACRELCDAEDAGQNAADNCAIYHNDRCYCASNCDNVKGNDVTPVCICVIIQIICNNH